MSDIFCIVKTLLKQNKMAYRFVHLFKRFLSCNRTYQSRFSSSAKVLPKSSLFISGERAKDTFVVVVPHLDFENSFSNLPLLEENITRRGLNFNVQELKDSWEFYKDWNNKKLWLQENLNKSSKEIREISKDVESEEKKIELEKLERYRDLIREDLQNVKKNVWFMEDNVIGELFKLPNLIHPETPDIEEELFVFDKENIKESVDHLQVGVKLNCLEYRNELECFLKNKAALFELAVPELFIDQFAEEGFIRFSNPDFARSVLMEGVGCTPKESSEVFLLENTEGNNDHLHLCGGASLFPFCGFHAKQTVPKQSLPVRYIASGRRYTPVTASLPGLYSVNQSTAVQIFVATHSEEETYNEFQSCVNKLQVIFSDLGLKFKMVKQTPRSLKSWESLRVSVQVFSPHEGVFVEVGHVSLIDDFISKRLRMCYTDKKEVFLKVVSGTVINIHTLLALCLERSQSDFFLPEVVKNYMLR